jgi:hypothetical protein
MNIVYHQTQLEALARLLEIAQRDTGQSRKVADFLLAWHNAEENGGWNPYDLWSLDSALADDIVSVLSLVRQGKYPDSLGFEREIGRVWQLWRGETVQPQ